MPEKKPRGGGKRNQTVPPICSRARGATRERDHPYFLATNVSFLFGCLPGGRGEGGAGDPLPCSCSLFFTARSPGLHVWAGVLGPLIMTALHARSAHHVHACMHPGKAGSRKACMC